MRRVCFKKQLVLLGLRKTLLETTRQIAEGEGAALTPAAFKPREQLKGKKFVLPITGKPNPEKIPYRLRRADDALRLLPRLLRCGGKSLNRPQTLKKLDYRGETG